MDFRRMIRSLNSPDRGVTLKKGNEMIKAIKKKHLVLKKYFLLSSFALSASFAPLTFASMTNQSSPTSLSEASPRRANAVIVRIREGASTVELEKLSKLLKKHSAKKDRDLLKGKAARYRLEQSEIASQEELVARAIEDTGAVDYAEPDYVMLPAFTPNDPFLTNQWFHKKISSFNAWNFGFGNAVITVGICDSGFDLNHPDLVGRFKLPGYNTVKDNTQIDAIHNHGTMTAGLIGATGNNTIGVAGLSWGIKILPIQISTSSDGASTYSDVSECIRYAADQGAKVVSLSYDFAYASALVNEAAAYLRSKGGLLVVAAGNGGSDISVWGPSPNMTVVGATDENDLIASFSNFGTAVDLVGPGLNIFTTVPQGFYEYSSGTSFSTPLVAATAALIYSLKPTLTPTEVETFILSKSLDLGPLGKDPQYGAGRLNAEAAIKTAATATDRTPPTIRILTPANAAVLSGNVSMTSTASDNVGVKSVTYTLDGVSIGTSALPPFSVLLNTQNYSNGAHTLLARAFDEFGNNASQSISVSISNAVRPPIVLDNLTAGARDSQRNFTGSWCNSSLSGSFGTGSLYNCGSQVDKYTFTPVIPNSQNYRVLIRYVSAANRSTAVPVTVIIGTTRTVRQVNMQTGGGAWYSLGNFTFPSGTGSRVEIGEATGITSIDGLKLEPL
jgi:thermitase